MKLCVVTDVPVKNITTMPECDVALFGFGCLGEVDYESELSGKSEKFEDVAKLSKAADCAVVCACITRGRGIKRKSCAVADRGKLLGISDMTHVIDDDDCKSGAHVGLYHANGYRVGMCIENDLYFPEDLRALSMCGAHAVCAVKEQLCDGVAPLLIRAYSYIYGVPMVMCAGRTAYFTGGAGSIASSTQSICLFEINTDRQYHIVGTRTQGLRAAHSEDY